jgi:hypothetical protein
MFHKIDPCVARKIIYKNDSIYEHPYIQTSE